MLDWMNDVVTTGNDVKLSDLLIRMTAALALGCVVAGIFRATGGGTRSQPARLTATLVLLTVLICLVTLVIGNSVARAFSLVGALAIVRFRTVVEDTRDTAFVIFAVAVGMAAGVGYLEVTLVGIPVAAAAAYLFRSRDDATPLRLIDYALKVRIAIGRSPEAALREPFERHLSQSRLIATATARQGSALDLTYAVRLRRDDGVVPLVTELNSIEGVQETELRQT